MKTNTLLNMLAMARGAATVMDFRPFFFSEEEKVREKERLRKEWLEVVLLRQATTSQEVVTCASKEAWARIAGQLVIAVLYFGIIAALIAASSHSLKDVAIPLFLIASFVLMDSPTKVVAALEKRLPQGIRGK